MCCGEVESAVRRCSGPKRDLGGCCINALLFGNFSVSSVLRLALLFPGFKLGQTAALPLWAESVFGRERESERGRKGFEHGSIGLLLPVEDHELLLHHLKALL